ncbi:hypothetical protein ACJJTC_000304 [Scirpophaga incertulas]
MEQLECEEVVVGSDRKKGESWWLRILKQRLPILRWVRNYGREAAAADVVAGLTLGLTLVPQSIAYAALADLPVQHGLYTSFMGTILYTFLGTVKEVSIGPTSLMALLTLQTCRGLPVEYVILLTFLSGWVVMFMGVLRLGFLVDLISPSVTSGFTSATAVIIVVAQLKGVLGLSFTAESVTENVSQLVARMHLIRPQDCALAAVCCTVLLLLRKLKDLKVGGPSVRRALWLVSIARNAIVVLAAATFAYYTHTPGQPLVLLSGRVAGGLPQLALPSWHAPGSNGTEVALPGMVRRLGGSLLMLPAVMVLANIAIAKAFSDGGRVDATQEMVALGLCNVAGSLVGAMPACGAFTRSAVGHASGVRTPAAGLVAGVITLLALMFLTEYFYYIPKACLSSVLICAVIFMIDYKIVRVLWRESRVEVAVVAATFALSVALSVEAGVLGGAAAALAALLHRLLAPRTRAAAAPRPGTCVCREGELLHRLLAPAPAPQLHRAQVRVCAARGSCCTGCWRPHPRRSCTAPRYVCVPRGGSCCTGCWRPHPRRSCTAPRYVCVPRGGAAAPAAGARTRAAAAPRPGTCVCREGELLHRLLAPAPEPQLHRAQVRVCAARGSCSPAAGARTRAAAAPRPGTCVCREGELLTGCWRPHPSRSCTAPRYVCVPRGGAAAPAAGARTRAAAAPRPGTCVCREGELLHRLLAPAPEPQLHRAQVRVCAARGSCCTGCWRPHPSRSCTAPRYVCVPRGGAAAPAAGARTRAAAAPRPGTCVCREGELLHRLLAPAPEPQLHRAQVRVCAARGSCSPAAGARTRAAAAPRPGTCVCREGELLHRLLAPAPEPQLHRAQVRVCVARGSCCTGCWRPHPSRSCTAPRYVCVPRGGAAAPAAGARTRAAAAPRPGTCVCREGELLHRLLAPAPEPQLHRAQVRVCAARGSCSPAAGARTRAAAAPRPGTCVCREGELLHRLLAPAPEPQLHRAQVRVCVARGSCCTGCWRPHPSRSCTAPRYVCVPRGGAAAPAAGARTRAAAAPRPGTCVCREGELLHRLLAPAPEPQLHRAQVRVCAARGSCSPAAGARTRAAAAPRPGTCVCREGELLHRLLAPAPEPQLHRAQVRVCAARGSCCTGCWRPHPSRSCTAPRYVCVPRGGAAHRLLAPAPEPQLHRAQVRVCAARGSCCTGCWRPHPSRSCTAPRYVCVPRGGAAAPAAGARTRAAAAPRPGTCVCREGELLHRLLAPAPAPQLHRAQVLGVRVVRMRMGAALVFANAARILDSVLPHIAGARALLLDCGALRLLDHAALQVLKGVSTQCKEEGLQFLPYNACPEIAQQLGSLGLGARVLTAPSAAEALAAADSKADVEHAAETDALLHHTDCSKDIASVP